MYEVEAKKTKASKAQYHIHLDNELYAELKRYSEKYRISMIDVIRIALIKFLELEGRS